MNRSEFADAFMERARHVLQKQNRANGIRDNLTAIRVHRPDSELQKWFETEVLPDAERDVDATLAELAFCIWDAAFDAYRDHVARSHQEARPA